MIGHLIHKELLTLIQSRRFVVIAGLFAVFVWACLADGALSYLDQQREYASARRYMEFRIDQIVNPEDRVYSWSEVFDMGYVVTKPPTALSILVRGIEPYVGRSAAIRYGRPDHQLYRSLASESPLRGTLPTLDLGTVVQVVFSLLTLLLAYDAVSGEKEEGTLRLLGTYSLPRAVLLSAKLGATAVVACLCFLVPFLVGIAAVLLHPDIHFSNAELVRAGSIVAATMLFLIVMACAGLAGSALTRQSATSFVLLLAFWVVGAVVVPRLSLVAADAVHTTPSLSEVETEKRAVNQELEAGRRENTTAWAEDYEAREGRAPWGTPDGMAAFYEHYVAEYLALLDVRKERWAPIEQAHRNRLDAWQGLALRLAMSSPTFSYAQVSTALAGTGLERHRRFVEACLEHLDTYQKWNLEDWAEFRVYSYRGHRYRDGKIQWNSEGVPRFAYQETWPAEDLAAAGIPGATLLVWGVLFFAAAAVAMLRYDLR